MELLFGDDEFCKDEVFAQIKEDLSCRVIRESLKDSPDEVLVMILRNDIAGNIWNDKTEAACLVLFERYPGKRVDDFLE